MGLSTRHRSPPVSPAAGEPHNGDREDVLGGVRAFARNVTRTFRRQSKPPADLPVLRKRRLTVPLSIYDNPHFTETEVVVDARYEQLRLVGSGRFGVVVSAVDTRTGSRVAIKKVLSAFSSTHAARHTLRELRLLAQLRHPHIVRLLDVDMPRSFRVWDSVYLVTSLLSRDLRAALLAGLLDAAQQRRALAQLLCALRYMHAHRVLHRDVKSFNVLVDAHGNVQLCDLGESRFCSQAGPALPDDEDLAPAPDPELTTGPRTPLQSAPELFLNEQYDVSVDLWGVGCIAAEMLHPEHKHLFNDPRTRNPLQTIVQILGDPGAEQTAHLEKRTSHVRLALAASRGRGASASNDALRDALSDEAGHVDEQGLDFVRRLLRFVPSERMSAEEALRHPFLADVVADVEESVAAVLQHGAASFDLSLTEPPERTARTRLKELAWEEIVAFHPEAARIHSTK